MSVSRAALLRKRLDKFARVLPGIEQGDIRALHAARVASRRLRELIPVLQLSSAEARKLARRLRKLTARLGIVRELDVLLLSIDELHVSRRQHREALGRVAMSVSKARDDARARLMEELPLDDMRKIAHKLERIADQLAARTRDVDSAAERAWRWATEARVARRASALGTAIDDAGSVYLVERLHAVRIALKKLRYAAELGAAALGEPAQTDIRVMKRAQEVLGDLHDRQVLIERVRQVQASLTPPSVALWRALDRLTDDLERDCRALHARYMRLRPELETLAARLARRMAETDGRRSHNAAG